MKNKEKFAKEIIDLACDESHIAIDKITKKLVSCNSIDCIKCLFNAEDEDCVGKLRDWAEAEYKVPLSVEAIYYEYVNFCSGKDCINCKYKGALNCAIKFIFDNYDVKEKAGVSENE